MYIFLMLLMVLFSSFLAWAWVNDYKEWNHGLHRDCGTPFVLFDHDSQGGRGYTCRKCHYYLWISYPVDKDYKSK